MPGEVVTAHLSLRALTEANLDHVHPLFSATGHTIGGGPVKDPAETLRWLARRQEVHQEEGLAWYGLWDSAQTFIGTCGLFLGSRTGNEPEIGYELADHARGRGLAREAAIAVSTAGHVAGFHSLWAAIREANSASSRVAEAAGYRYVRTEPEARGPLRFYRRRGPGQV